MVFGSAGINKTKNDLELEGIVRPQIQLLGTTATGVNSFTTTGADMRPSNFCPITTFADNV